MKLAAINRHIDKYVTGETKADIVNQALTWRIDGNNTLWAKTSLYKEVEFHSYNREEFTEAEMYREAERFLFDKLQSFGWKTYVVL